MPQQLYEHILGGLLGQAFGDAFAMPALLHPEDTWKCYGGWLTDFHPGPAGHPVHEGLPAARVTDDTEQAFALAASAGHFHFQCFTRFHQTVRPVSRKVAKRSVSCKAWKWS